MKPILLALGLLLMTLNCHSAEYLLLNNGSIYVLENRSCASLQAVLNWSAAWGAPQCNQDPIVIGSLIYSPNYPNDIKYIVKAFLPDLSTLSEGGSSVSAETIAALQQAIAALQSAQSISSDSLEKLLNAQAKPFDPAFAGAVFAFFFSGVVLLWVVAKGAGAVISAIRGRR